MRGRLPGGAGLGVSGVLLDDSRGSPGGEYLDRLDPREQGQDSFGWHYGPMGGDIGSQDDPARQEAGWAVRTLVRGQEAEGRDDEDGE